MGWITASILPIMDKTVKIRHETNNKNLLYCQKLGFYGVHGWCQIINGVESYLDERVIEYRYITKKEKI